MKALIKPNMYTHLARRGLSKYLQNSITHIPRVESDKVEQSPPNDDTPRTCKNVHLMEKGINQLNIRWAK